jgi:hypothetical protein
MKTYFDALDMNYAANLFVNKVDDRDEIKRRPSALKKAYHLGSQLTATDTPPPQEPIDIEAD